MTPSRLLLFCRAPVLGRVKTRLAKDVGDEQALDYYQQMLRHNFSVASQLKNIQKIIVTDDAQHDFFQHYSDQGFAIQQQSGGELGERLIRAFNENLQYADHVVLIGVDSFDFTAELLQQAFEGLIDNDLVLSPVEDGGYILIGLKQAVDTLFDNISWGTPLVLQQTLQQAQNKNLSVFLTGFLRDIDTVDDLIFKRI